MFRIGPDGLAHEIIGRIVRPGKSYVIITQSLICSDHSFFTPCDIEFEGVNSYILTVPDTLTNQDIEWLKSLDLEVARTVRVWPAGLTGRNWDGEGHSEWLTTESPCFGITHDYPVDKYRIRLDGGDEELIYADRVGYPTFFQLSPLEEGLHTLRVTALAEPSPELPPTPDAEGFLSLYVRHPKAWVPGITSHDALIVTLDPPDANLQNFSENEIQLSVYGPESRHVAVDVSLCRSDGEHIYSEQIANHVELPIKPEQWREIFDKFVKRHSEYSWLYHEAFEGILEIKAEDIGSRTIRFNHDFSALRWVVRRDEKNQTIKLVDDTGVDDIQLGAYFVPFTNPASTEDLSLNELQIGFGIPDPGGLLVAHRGQQKDCVVISNLVTGSGLAALGVRADFEKITQMSFSNALHLYETWYGARLVGPLVQLRRNYIIHGIISAVYEKIAGPQWMKIENSFLSHPSAGGAAALQNNIEPKNGFGVALKSDFQRFDHDFSDIVNRYSMLAQTYQICDNQSVSEFALLLAKEPHKVREVYGSELNTAFKELSKYPAIFRGARMLALLGSENK